MAATVEPAASYMQFNPRDSTKVSLVLRRLNMTLHTILREQPPVKEKKVRFLPPPTISRLELALDTCWVQMTSSPRFYSYRMATALLRFKTLGLRASTCKSIRYRPTSLPRARAAVLLGLFLPHIVPKTASFQNLKNLGQTREMDKHQHDSKRET